MAQSKRKTDLGHWEFYAEYFKPEDYFGFTYMITFLLTGERYVGKKQFWRCNKAGTKRYGPSDWRTYTSSSEHVNALLAEYGMDAFSFEILQLNCSKGCSSYVESNVLHKIDSLTIPHPFLKEQRLFINRQIGPIRWIPKNCECVKAVESTVRHIKHGIQELSEPNE